MIERPILLNADMVNAVLSGEKTQTRRFVKQQRDTAVWSVKPTEKPRHKSHTHDWWLPTGTEPYSALPGCPYGVVGDRLWVREKTRVLSHQPDDMAQVRYEADGALATIVIPSRLRRVEPGRCLSNGCHREASRITLEIISLRVERLNDISEADARAEGVQQLRGGIWRHYQPGWTQHQLSARGSYVTLWDSIYGEGSWRANPWVWVIEFERIVGE